MITLSKSVILLCLLAVLPVGCKMYLDEPLLGNYSDGTFFRTEAQAVLAINAAYTPLTFSSDRNRLWVFGDVASDDAAKGGDPGDQADIGLVDDFQIFPSNGPVETQWGEFYEGVARCNQVLTRVPGITMTEGVKTRILGEARFLRAMYYFYLVNIYGPVPLLLEPKNADQLQIPQSPVATIYEQGIEPDLQEAIRNLPATYEGGNVGRATKGAATALLAKAYLYQQKWQQAATTAGQVQAIGNYALLPVYSQNFNQATKNNREAVFSVQHLTGQVPFTGNRLNQYFAPRSGENGYFFNVPTPGFVAEFEKTSANAAAGVVTGVVDPRLDYTVGRAGTTWLNGEPFDPGWSPTGFLNKKHVQPLAEIPASNKGDGNLNYVAIRFADVLLMQAEALNELGRSAEALPLLNQVRKRARESYGNDPALAKTVPAGLLPDVITTAQQSLREAIRHERRVELGFEFHRYFDLMRYGRDVAQAALRDKTGFVYATNRYFPIPQSERDTNKALMF